MQTDRAISFRLSFIQYFSFFTIGMVGNFVGPVIPLIRDELHLSYGLVGIIFPAQSIGGLSVPLLSGFLIHTLGKRKFIVAGCSVMIAGLAACSLASDYFLFVAGDAFLGEGRLEGTRYTIVDYVILYIRTFILRYSCL